MRHLAYRYITLLWTDPEPDHKRRLGQYETADRDFNVYDVRPGDYCLVGDRP